MNFFAPCQNHSFTVLHDFSVDFQESDRISRLGLIDGDISRISDVFQLRTVLLIEVEMSCDFVRFPGIVFNQIIQL